MLGARSVPGHAARGTAADFVADLLMMQSNWVIGA